MKENPLPLKDLKTGVKVTTIVAESVFESIKPTLKRVMIEKTNNILRTLSKKNF